MTNLLTTILSLILITSNLFANSKPPYAKILNLSDQSQLNAQTLIEVYTPDKRKIVKVSFLIDEKIVYEDFEYPYEYLWDICKQNREKHILSVKIENIYNLVGTSDPIEVYTNGKYDCKNICGGTNYKDNCGICDDIIDNDCVKDCAGNWGGNATLDNCNTCDSDESNNCIQDCLGVWGGNASKDCLGICDGSAKRDCNGICNGSSVLDQCGICDDEDSNNCTQDCLGIWGGSASEDCAGVCNGNSSLDKCNVCDSNDLNNCTQDCLGIWGGSASEDCAGVCNGNSSLDKCNVCDSNDLNNCTQDCLGIWGGNTKKDCAGVCGGKSRILSYWFDRDNDGLGGDQYSEFCNSNVEKGWVGNNNDPNDNCFSNNFDCLGECNGTFNEPKDCNGVCYGNSKEKDFCYDLNGDGIGNVKIMKSFCPNAVDENWVSRCKIINGYITIKSNYDNLNYLKLNGSKVKFLDQPKKVEIGSYELLIRKKYLLKNFEIIKKFEVLENETSEIFVGQEDFSKKMKTHRNKIILSSSVTFLLWLTWGLLPYEI